MQTDEAATNQLRDWITGILHSEAGVSVEVNGSKPEAYDANQDKTAIRTEVNQAAAEAEAVKAWRSYMTSDYGVSTLAKMFE